VFNPPKSPCDIDSCVEFYMKNIGIEWYPLLRYYAAWDEDGVPVCTAQSWHCAGVLGIYSVATLPSHRRQGAQPVPSVASALLDPAVRSVEGAPDVAVLESSPEAFSLYTSLGFRVADHWDVYAPATP